MESIANSYLCLEFLLSSAGSLAPLGLGESVSVRKQI
jgi:hypothetical protein